MTIFGTEKTYLTNGEKLNEAGWIIFRMVFFIFIIFSYFQGLYFFIVVVGFFWASLKLGLEIRRLVQLFKNLKIDR